MVVFLCVFIITLVNSEFMCHRTLIMTTHTHTFNGPLSGTTRVSQYQKGKTNLDFTGARDSELQWYQLGHMQICTSLQSDNHASTPPLSFYRPDALPAAQPTASKHWRDMTTVSSKCGITKVIITSHYNVFVMNLRIYSSCMSSVSGAENCQLI